MIATPRSVIRGSYHFFNIYHLLWLLAQLYPKLSTQIETVANGKHDGTELRIFVIIAP